jgi:excisionase family DNA binding protein
MKKKCKLLSSILLMQKIEEKEFYLVEELAAKLRVNVMTIYRYIKAGKIEAHKLGKEYRIDRQEFEKFLLRTSTK